MTLDVVFIVAVWIAILFAGNWWLAGWSLRGGNGRLLVAILTSWILTTIIGLIVLLAFRSIRKRRAREATAAVQRIPLEACVGDQPGCPHYDCPDGFHRDDDLPCSCTPDCALVDADPTFP